VPGEAAMRAPAGPFVFRRDADERGRRTEAGREPFVRGRVLDDALAEPLAEQADVAALAVVLDRQLEIGRIGGGQPEPVAGRLGAEGRHRGELALAEEAAVRLDEHE